MKGQLSVLKKAISLLIIFILLAEPLLAVSYEGTTYSGTKYKGNVYNGISYAGIPYKGISIGGIYYEGISYDGILYEGIDLSDIKFTCCTISGNETDEMFFNQSIPEEYRVNWKKVIANFAIGTTIIVITGILDLAFCETPYVVIFATALKREIENSIVGATIGAVVGAMIGAIVDNKNFSLAKKNAIEGAAEGFMWGCITGALQGGIEGYNQYKANLDNVSSLIPKSKEIQVGTKKGYINGQNIKDVDGNILAKVNNSGQVYTINPKNEPELLDQLDAFGNSSKSLQTARNAGLNFDMSEKIINKTKIINGTKFYLDAAEKPIAYEKIAIDSLGEKQRFIMQTLDADSARVVGDIPKAGLGKLVGKLTEDGSLDHDCLKYITNMRRRAVSEAWASEAQMVRNTGKGTYNWNPEQIEELLGKGKVSGFEGHHINSVMSSPELAGNPNNIRFFTSQEHLVIGHGGNFQNITFGELIERI